MLFSLIVDHLCLHQDVCLTLLFVLSPTNGTRAAGDLHRMTNEEFVMTGREGEQVNFNRVSMCL